MGTQIRVKASWLSTTFFLEDHAINSKTFLEDQVAISKSFLEDYEVISSFIFWKIPLRIPTF